MADMTLRQFAAHLAGIAAAEPSALKRGLMRAGAIVEAEAKAEIGTYQIEPRGPSGSWPLLSPATVADRRRKGYRPDDPLLREGDLRASIHHRADSSEMVTGSDEPIAEWQEMGTRTIPARSFLGTALFRKRDEAVAAVVEEVLRPLVLGR